MFEYGRDNLSTRAKISGVFSTGTFKEARLGIYTNGPRKDTPCVAKNFLRNDPRQFQAELDILNGAQPIIDTFNSAQVIPYQVLLNRFELWDLHLAESPNTASAAVHRENTGHGFTMIEPHIEGIAGFERFVGVYHAPERLGTPRYDAMHAFLHWSYHSSDGQLLLCDLQGGILEKDVNGNSVDPYYALTDPVIMSAEECGFGENDAGPEGILRIMRAHACTPFCRSEWRKPVDLGGGAWEL